VFGNRYTPPPPGAADFATVNGDGPGNTIGGIDGMDESFPAEIPAHSDTYFMVSDAQVAVARALAGGGTVAVPTLDTPFGRMRAIACGGCG